MLTDRLGVSEKVRKLPISSGDIARAACNGDTIWPCRSIERAASVALRLNLNVSSADQGPMIARLRRVATLPPTLTSPICAQWSSADVAARGPHAV
jgi:hypothetical protein